MRISEKWLRDWVDPELTTAELAEQMTLLGLEVDEFESAQPEFSGVVVAEVVAAEKHPDADNLKVCQVNYGADETATIVCGAPNAKAGLKAPLATVGARLPGGMKIRKTKLRGVASQGMLCSSVELGLGTESDGLLALPVDAPPGSPLEDYLELGDQILTVELTPNRGDCLSIRGLARDLCARNNLDLKEHEVEAVRPSIDDDMVVKVDVDSTCARYAGRIVRGVDCSVPTPLAIVERLRRSGIRSINPAVDITNYVMLERGQPMHAFDLDKVQGNIHVRLARPKERVTLLDGRDIALEEDITVIADDSGAIGIAGIMGGLSTAVDEQTSNIYFESALFLPELIAGKAWRLDAHTDSSHRFERGVDPDGQIEALEYATGLLLSMSGGNAGPVRDWISSNRLPVGEQLLLRRNRVTALLGKELSDDDIESILTRLAVSLSTEPAGWLVTPPSHRYDLRIEEDYIEELARVHGFDNLPRTMGQWQPGFSAVSETVVGLDSLKNLLVSRGYQEIVTFSFVDADLQAELLPDSRSLAVSNPISADLSVMRTSLITGLLSTLKRNLNRQTPDLRIFESGLIYAPQDTELKQEMMLGGLISGRRYPESWNQSAALVDFFDIKGDLEAIFARVNNNKLEMRPASRTFLHPGKSAEIFSNGINIGWIGQLHPQLQKSLDVSQLPLMFEVSVDGLGTAQVPDHEEISRFPGVRRDLSMVVSQSTSDDSLKQCIRANGPDWLKNIVTFDVYSGDKVEPGMKSVALGLILQDFSRTLEEAEVETAVQRIIESLNRELGAILRV